MPSVRPSPLDSVDLSPDWRYERVLELIDRNPPAPCRRFDDQPTREMREFLLRFRRFGTKSRGWLDKRYPGPSAAYSLYLSSDYKLRMTIECEILAGLSDENIAARHAMSRLAIQRYEAIFFWVRERLPARDWIFRRAIPAARDSLFPDERMLKLFAYFRGPYALEYLLSTYDPFKMDPDDDDVRSSFKEYTRRVLYRKLISALINDEFDEDSTLALVKMARSKQSVGELVDEQLDRIMEGARAALDAMTSTKPERVQDPSLTDSANQNATSTPPGLDTVTIADLPSLPRSAVA